MFNYEIFDKNINKYAREQLITKIELFDEIYFKKYDKSKYDLVDRRQRKQLTQYGNIYFKRRKYRDKKTGKMFVTVDNYFGIVKNKTINSHLWNTIFDEVDGGSTIPQIKKLIPNAKISHASISSILSAKDPIITSTSVIKKNKTSKWWFH